MITATNNIKNFCSRLIIMGTTLFCGCSVLTPANVPLVSRYSFDSAAATVHVTREIAVTRVATINVPTLVVSIPRAAAGFDSAHMAYVRQAHQLEYFQQSEWIEAPVAMLAPLVVSALERSGGFGAVVQSPTSVIGQLRLDLKIVRLQQEFFSTPSKVRFTLRAHLVDSTTRQVIAWHEFDTSVVSVSEDAYGGVLAANIAIQTVMGELASFCVQANDHHMKNEKIQKE